MRLRIALGVLLLGVTANILHPQEPSRSVWDGVYTQGQADQGETLYARECASCHGAALTGGEAAPPLAGGEFLANWNGLTLGDLFERIRTTMPLSKPGKLTRDVNTAILAYILAVNKFPAGERDLSNKTELLKQIRINAINPSDKRAK